ncbi:PAC2 family protein [Rathayibacter toxicus]|uniref:PAC2 family protein n=1 Tax=Rathayibacter toxicus TaxID=145458 RepID=UPI000A75A4C1
MFLTANNDRSTGLSAGLTGPGSILVIGAGADRSPDIEPNAETLKPMNVIKGNVLVVAFEGWNDAGDAASGAVRLVKDDGDFVPLFAVDPEQYYDFQYTRPTLSIGEDGRRCLSWPGTQIFGPATTSADDEITPYVMLGTEPSRSWKSFATEVVDTMLAIDISTVVFLGAMLADVPHTRPISLFASSENAELRSAFDLERSNYEGPVGILSVIGETAAKVGIPAMTLWASVPHYVHSAPSPKATLALLEKLEEVLGVATPAATSWNKLRSGNVALTRLRPMTRTWPRTSRSSSTRATRSTRRKPAVKPSPRSSSATSVAAVMDAQATSHDAAKA